MFVRFCPRYMRRDEDSINGYNRSLTMGRWDKSGIRNRVQLRNELRSEFAGDIEWIIESEQHLLKIFRFYIIILGAFISLHSVLISQELVDVGAVLNLYTLSAVAFWTVAVLGAITAFIVIWATTGIHEAHQSDYEVDRAGELLGQNRAEVFEHRNLRILLDMPPSVFEEELIYYYIQAIHHNQSELGRVRYPFLYGGMTLVLIAVLVFGLGILLPVSGLPLPAEWWAGNRTPLGTYTHIGGLILLLLGTLISLFLLLQAVALRDRIVKKFKLSEARFPPATKLLDIQDFKLNSPSPRDGPDSDE